MQRFSILLFLAPLVFLFASCQTATPEKCFDVAVLNSNALVGFAAEGLWRELQSPSAKMGKTKDEVLTMQRSEVIAQRRKFVEENLEKLKALPQTDDTEDIILASLALHQYILPVYRNEYTQLAKSFDGGAPKGQVEMQAKAIHDKHFSTFETLYNKLISHGKVYAEKHGIEVKWAM